MKTSKKKTSKTAMAEAREIGYASMIEDAVTYIECSDYDRGVAISDGWIANGDTLGQVRATENLLGLNCMADTEDATRSPTTGLFLSGDGRGVRYMTLSASKVSVVERVKLATLGAIPLGVNPVRAQTIRYMEDGKTTKAVEYFRLSAGGGTNNNWMPVWGNGFKPTGKMRTAFFNTKHSTRYKTYEILEQSSPNSKGPAMMQSANWAMRHLWHVRIKAFGGDRGILYATSAAGVRGFFSLRDKPNGMSRRAALCHWVKAHSRAASSSEDETDVRSHVRGERRFGWFGLDCEVLDPPEMSDAQKSTIRQRAIIGLAETKRLELVS